MRPTLFALALLFLPAGAAHAAPKADLWPYWEAHDPASEATIDHAAWAAFLESYVVPGDDGVHRVRYGDVSPADRAALDAYLSDLAAVPIRSYARPEQMAYWINLYNALTVQVVLDHYPVDSIRDIDISPGLFSSGPWGAELITVEGEALTLDDIEHRILRPIWRDPRVHYGVNCASIGCPDLARAPFTGADLDAQLDQAARAYVNHPRGVTIERDELIVSSIYDWFEADFGSSEAGVIAHLRRYAEPTLAERLARFDAIDGDRYDWRLNDAR